jgi:hypothetical protein
MPFPFMAAECPLVAAVLPFVSDAFSAVLADSSCESKNSCLEPLFGARKGFSPAESTR